jgi:hypothetical protein
MKLGLLADIHEHTRRLQKAIAVLQEHGAERFVVLGEVFDTGKRFERTVRLLEQVRAVGVWGNHGVGLCFDPGDSVCERYGVAVLGFMGGLQPHLEVDGSGSRRGLLLSCSAWGRLPAPRSTRNGTGWHSWTGFLS